MDFPRCNIILRALFSRLNPRFDTSERGWKQLLKTLKESKILSNVKDHGPEWRGFGQEKADIQRETLRGVYERAKDQAKLIALESDSFDIQKAIDEATLIKLNEFPTLLSELKIDDVDTLLGICDYLENEEVAALEIKRGDRYEKYYNFRGTERPYKVAVKDETWQSLGKDKLRHHRALLERVFLPPETNTGRDKHYGHESILVLEGEVTFSLDKAGLLEEYRLVKGDFLSFNCMCHHGCKNESKTDCAEFVVSRTMLSVNYGVIRG